MKITKINTPQCRAASATTARKPPGLVFVTAFEAHCDAKFHELEDLPSISNIAERHRRRTSVF